MTLLAGCQAQFQSANAEETQNSLLGSDENTSCTFGIEKGGAEENLSNNKNTDSDFIATELIINEKLESWVGDYYFEEVGSPTHHCMEYNIAIYNESGEYYANISIDGWLTLYRLKAKVVGDDKFIKLVFCEYLPDSYVPEYAQMEVDVVLLSFERNEADLLTYWGCIEPFTPQNEESGRIYFKLVE